MILAIDTGGTKTLFDEIENGKVIRELRKPTPHNPDEYTTMLRGVIQNDFCGTYSQIIIALPSDIDHDLVKATPNLFSEDFNIINALKGITDTPVTVFNDAKLATIGAATGQGREMYLTLSTGIGAGLAIDGELSRDLSSLEIGRMIVNDQTWESLASARAFVEKHDGKLSTDIPVDDPAWQEYAENVSLGLLDAIPVLRPDKIIFGGAMSLNFDKFAGPLRTILENAFKDRIRVPELVKSDDPEHAVILGAIKYAERNF